MTEWTSLSVTEEQKAKIEAAQEQAGHDGAIGRFLAQQIVDSARKEPKTTVEVDADEVVDELKEAIVELNCPVTPDEEKSSEELVAKIEQLEAAVKEATQAAQSTEQTVEDLQG